MDESRKKEVHSKRGEMRHAKRSGGRLAEVEGKGRNVRGIGKKKKLKGKETRVNEHGNGRVSERTKENVLHGKRG